MVFLIFDGFSCSCRLPRLTSWIFHSGKVRNLIISGLQVPKPSMSTCERVECVCSQKILQWLFCDRVVGFSRTQCVSALTFWTWYPGCNAAFSLWCSELWQVNGVLQIQLPFSLKRGEHNRHSQKIIFQNNNTTTTIIIIISFFFYYLKSFCLPPD